MAFCRVFCAVSGGRAQPGKVLFLQVQSCREPVFDRVRAGFRRCLLNRNFRLVVLQSLRTCGQAAEVSIRVLQAAPEERLLLSAPVRKKSVK